MPYPFKKGRDYFTPPNLKLPSINDGEAVDVMVFTHCNKVNLCFYPDKDIIAVFENYDGRDVMQFDRKHLIKLLVEMEKTE